MMGKPISHKFRENEGIVTGDVTGKSKGGTRASIAEDERRRALWHCSATAADTTGSRRGSGSTSRNCSAGRERATVGEAESCSRKGVVHTLLKKRD